MRIARSLLPWVAGGLCCSFASAAENRPASFLPEFAGTIDFPAGNDIIVSVPCRATVDRGGRLQDSRCFVASDTALPYARAVLAAAEAARLEPAVVDGVVQPVLVHYTIRFEKLAANVQVRAVLNHGAHAALYGRDYVDPQVIEPLEVDRRPDGSDCSSSPDVLWISAMIAADGRVLQPGVNAGRISSTCRRSLIREIRRWRFIPAFSGGRPVDAFFSQALLRNPAPITRVDASRVSIE